MHFCGTPFRNRPCLESVETECFGPCGKNEVPGSFEKKECFKACGKKSPAMSHDLFGCEMLSLKGRFDEAEIAAKFGL